MDCTSKKTFNQTPLLKSAQNRFHGGQQPQPLHQPTKTSTINDIASLIAAILPGTTAAQQTSPLGGNQTQQIGNIINPALLPPEVQQQLQKGKQHNTYHTKQERCSFNSTTPNIIVDPAGNTMRKIFHFMDGPHQIITRSGDLFYFSKWDEKK